VRRALAVAFALAACDAAPRTDRRAAADALVEAVRSLRAFPRTRPAARAVLAAGRRAEPPPHRLADPRSIVDEMASGANAPS
jgi:hypothetical protein